VLEVEAFNGLVGASDEVLAGAMPGAVAQFAGLMRTGSHDKIAFTDKNVKENYLCHWGRDGLTGFKSLVKICSQPTNEETLSVDHKKITCPTAVFWALHDAWMPKESGERLKQDIAGPVRLQFIERAGHWSQEDRPDEVAAMIEDFITEWEGVKI
jgi:pimeloyl-ACP methyl ester carboxylesterase